METPARANAPSEMGEQYSLGRILGIWALAAVEILGTRTAARPHYTVCVVVPGDWVA
jgi:hypothetical protein